MTEDFIISLGRDALVTTVLVALPAMALALLTGLVISIFQATTQIHEQTLAFAPKIIAVMAALALFGPWMLTVMLDFTSRVFLMLPGLMR
ncbi:MAG: flagellar biosynthesis protein FliQ [Bacillota bacterium]